MKLAIELGGVQPENLALTTQWVQHAEKLGVDMAFSAEAWWSDAVTPTSLWLVLPPVGGCSLTPPTVEVCRVAADSSASLSTCCWVGRAALVSIARASAGRG